MDGTLQGLLEPYKHVMRVERPEIGFKRSRVRCWEDKSETKVVRWWEGLEMHQKLLLVMCDALEWKVPEQKLPT